MSRETSRKIKKLEQKVSERESGIVTVNIKTKVEDNKTLEAQKIVIDKASGDHLVFPPKKPGESGGEPELRKSKRPIYRDIDE